MTRYSAEFRCERAVHHGHEQNRRSSPIGLTSTQRQMIAWSIAALAEKQRSPQGFEPKPGAKLPDQLKSAFINE
ncbi:hypothetical protein [Bradyrhizobium sp.]|uniref:hypothetical protein n=1 Tax=Bradyrhizobium sp. TaxID=376 RepID=UPI000AA222F4|nr:hypothetical protein [Bradyrhizobium sp.]